MGTGSGVTATGVAAATITLVFTGIAFLRSCSLGFRPNGFKREIKLRLPRSELILGSDGAPTGLEGRTAVELSTGADTEGGRDTGTGAGAGAGEEAAEGGATSSCAGFITRSALTKVAEISGGRFGGVALIEDFAGLSN